jgi:hypothetical protein
MKKLLLIIIGAFLLVFGFLYFSQKKPAAGIAASQLPFFKKVDAAQLKAAKRLNTGAYTYRLYLYGDSLYLLSGNGNKEIISTDTGLHGIRRQPFPFTLRKNSVWYFNKEGGVTSYLTYPSGNILQVGNGTIDSFPQRLPVNNCVNTANIFWGQTSDSADRTLFITSFDMERKTMQRRFDMYEMFRPVKNFSPDCFNASMDGSFFRITDSLFLFYNYYSSYVVQFSNRGYTVYCGIDSVPLRKFKKQVAKSGDYTIERCEPESQRLIQLSGCSDGRFVYILSNITRKELNNQLMVDVYHAANMKYQRSFIIPDRNKSKPVDITTSATTNSLYILYGDNELVQYTKPL